MLRIRMGKKLNVSFDCMDSDESGYIALKVIVQGRKSVQDVRPFFKGNVRREA